MAFALDQCRSAAFVSGCEISQLRKGFSSHRGRDEKELSVVIRFGDASARELLLDHRMSFFKNISHPQAKCFEVQNAGVSFAASDPYLYSVGFGSQMCEII